MTEKSMQEKIVVLDFGGQYNQLIARRVRDGGVYAEIYPYAKPRETWLDESVKGVILTGGPSSVYLPGAPGADVDLFSLGVPVLGICYGMQLLAHKAGGTVEHADVSEYGHTVLHARGGALFAGVSPQTVVFMNHTDRVTALPEGFSIDASTDNCPIAAYSCPSRGLYGVQFHPEVRHSVEGDRVLNNFVYGVCGCQGGYRADDLIDRMIERVRAQVGEGTVVAGLSGGVDSSVACVLASRALKKEQLTCVFVDHGLLRKDEAAQVMRTYRENLGLNVVHVDASEKFLAALRGVTEPEQKRKIIGELFVRTFEEEAAKTGADFLLQGTIYPDKIESGMGGSATIKSHHNVGGLPKESRFSGHIVEPLDALFKDEVRAVGLALGIPRPMVMRQPRARPRRARDGRNHPRKTRRAARLRRDLPGRTGTRRPRRRDLAVLRRAHRRAHRGRDGRWPHLRQLRGPARRHHRGRHDCGSRGNPLSRAQKNRQPHHRRGAGRQPRGVRYH